MGNREQIKDVLSAHIKSGQWAIELEDDLLRAYDSIVQELAEAKKKIEKEPCCVSCIEDKNSGYGDDIEGCCCYHGGHKIFDTLRKENEEAWLKALLSELPEKKPSPKGRDCNCEAHSYNECGCNADWSDNDGFNSAIDIIREKLNKKRT